MEDRLEQLRTLYFETPKTDALLIQSSVYRRYLLHFKSSAGTLILLKDAAYFIIDFRYYEKACAVIRNCEVILQENLIEQMKTILFRHGVATLGLEDDRVTLSEYRAYQNRLPEYDIRMNSGVCDLVSEMRAVKSIEEIGSIKKAQAITDAAFSHILNVIRPGITERQIALELDYTMQKLGAEGLAFDTIAVAGKNGSMPHGVPSGYEVCSGDFVTMDFGAVINGYHSDMTRTVAVGQISELQQKVYDTVLEAQQMALDEIKTGQVCSEIDKVARDHIYNNGFSGCFGHSLGHSVGLEIHEQPGFSPSCQTVLKRGMVLSVEPGIYLAGKFGVRIEDLIVVGENSVMNLTKSEKKLICL